MPGTSQVDEEIEATARNALAETTLDWPVITITVTTAQSILPKISAELSVNARELASQVSELFMTHGLSAFPIIIVDQTLVSYGGAPDQAIILSALFKATETKKDAALQGFNENAASDATSRQTRPTYWRYGASRFTHCSSTAERWLGGSRDYPHPEKQYRRQHSARNSA